MRVRFRSYMCKLRMHNFEIVQRILQIAQIDKSRTKMIMTWVAGYILR